MQVGYKELEGKSDNYGNQQSNIDDLDYNIDSIFANIKLNE